MNGIYSYTMLLLPELLLCLTALVILCLDIFWRGDEQKGRIFPWLGLGGLLLTFLGTLPLVGKNVPLAFGQTDMLPMLTVDGMAVFFKFFTVLTLAMVLLASLDYMRERTKYKGEFIALLLLAGLAIMFAASSVNLIMIFISIEFLSITSYILVGFLRNDKLSVEGAMKYFLYGAVASGVMLYGFSLLYGATGSTDLAAIATILSTSHYTVKWLVYPVIVLILAGLGFKIALVPFHQWSPDAYEGAPTPVTAFLSVGPKAAGFAVLMRVMVTALPDFNPDWMSVLAGVSVITMFLGNLVAIWQKNIKRMLAYSSIAQAGYMLIGVVSIAPTFESWTNGVNTVLLYLFAYLFTNLGAFTVVILVEEATGSAEIENYKGLIKRAPFIAVAMFIFMLSLIGIPPTGGFMGKLFVFGAALQRQMYLLAALGVLNSVISVYYYMNVVQKMFFDSAEEGAESIKPGTALNVVVAVSTVMVLLIALYAQPFIGMVAEPAAQILAAF